MGVDASKARRAFEVENMTYDLQLSRVCSESLTARSLAAYVVSVRLTPLPLALVLTALTATLTPLAYADPPDPTWILGFWDDEDFDDVVGYLASATALPHIPVTCEYRRIAPREGLKPTAFRAAGIPIPHTVSSPRAPPTF